MSAAESKARPVPAAHAPAKRGLLAKLGRLAKHVVLWGLVCALLLRIALGFAMPWLVARGGALAGLSLAYEDLDLSMLGGRVELWGLDARLAPPAGESDAAPAPATFVPGEREVSEDPERLARLEYLLLDVDMSALLTGRLRVHRVEIDGLDAYARRDASGVWNFAALAGPGQPAEDEEPPEEPRELEPIELGSPVELRAVRVQQARLHLDDQFVQPGVEAQLELQVAISDIGSRERPTSIDVWAAGDGLDGLRLTGQASSGGPRLVADLDLALRGLRAGQYACYLDALAIEAAANTVDLRTAIRVDISPAEDSGRRGNAELEAPDTSGDAARPSEVYAVGMQATISDIAWLADGAEQLGVDAIEFTAPRLGGRAIEIDVARVRGVRGSATRQADGALAVGGFRLLPSAPGTSADEPPSAPAPAQESTPAAGLAAADTAEQEPLTALIARLAVEDVQLAFSDETTTPPARLELDVVELALDNIVLDPEQPEAPLAISGSLAAPGIFEQLELAGSATPFAPEKSFDLELDLRGLEPERAAGWLHAAGLDSNFESGHLTARLSATVTIDEHGTRLAGRLGDVVLSEEDPTSVARQGIEGPLFALEAVELSQLSILPEENTVHLTNLELRGLRLPLRRDAQGSLHVAGLQTLLEPNAAGAGSEAAPAKSEGTAGDTADGPADGPVADAAEPGSAPSEPAPTRILVDRVAWSDTLITWRDEHFEEPVELALSDLSFVLEALELGGQPGSAALEPARLTLELASAGLADQLSLSGTIASQPGPLDLALTLALDGTGLTLEPIAPYLEELGMQSQFVDGSLRAGLGLTVREQRDESGVDSLLFSAELDDLALVAGDTTWAAIEALRVPSVRVAPAGVEIDEVRLSGLRLVARRNADGSLEFAETRLVPTEDATQETGPSSGEVELEQLLDPDRNASQVADTADAGGASSESASSGGAGSALRLGRLLVEDMQLSLADAAVEPAFATDITVAVELGNLVLGSDSGAESATFAVQVAADGVVDRLELEGSLRPDPDNLALAMRLGLSGVDGAPLAGYLPPGTTFDVSDGHADLSLEASVRALANGGLSVEALLDELTWREGSDGVPMLALERLAFVAPDLGGLEAGAPSAQYLVSEFTLEGFELEASRTSETTFEALGFTISLAPEPAVDSASGEPAPAAEAHADTDNTDNTDNDGQVAQAEPGASEEAGAVVVQDAASGNAAASLSEQPPSAGSVARADKVPPTVIVEQLDLGLARLLFQDLSRADSQPMVASLRLSLPEATTLLAPQPQDLAPLVLELVGSADPIGKLEARLSAAPWALDPQLDLSLALSELSGAGLTAVLPELSATLDGSELDGGRFETGLEGTLRLRRRSPIDFDLSSGFGAQLDVHETSWRATPEGPVLLGFERLGVDVRHVRPDTGDVHVTEVELLKPILRARQDAAGLHVLGLTLLTPEPADEESAQGEDAGDTGETGQALARSDDPSSAETAQPAAEIQVDRLSVLGLDLEFVDESVVPKLVMPIDDMELLVERFTTAGFHEPRPFQFQLALYGGKVELPTPSEGDSLLKGILKSAGSAITSGRQERGTTLRPVFDEILVNGRLALYPQPRGWVKLRVAALELTSVAGAASTAGVTISDGVLDSAVEVRLTEEGLLTTTKTTFDRLSMSEPANGPISRFLLLPAPLDTVLFALRDEDGEQTIPLDLDIPPEGVSIGNVTKEASKTLGKIITDAIASSPLRVVGGLLDLAGLKSDDPVELDGATRWISFAAGQTGFTAGEWELVAPLAEILRKNDEVELVVQHEISDGDYIVAQALSSPSREDLLAVGANLRKRKLQLEAERLQLGDAVRRSFALGERQRAAQEARTLAAIEQGLGQTERALDEIYALLQPGAERRAGKRTRAACREIAEQRMNAVRDALLSLPIKNIAERVSIRRPRIELPPEGLVFDPDVALVGGRVTLTPKGRE